MEAFTDRLGALAKCTDTIHKVLNNRNKPPISDARIKADLDTHINEMISNVNALNFPSTTLLSPLLFNPLSPKLRPWNTIKLSFRRN